jgi:hypothetical protein
MRYRSAPAWPLEPAPEGSPLGQWGQSVIDRVVACIEAAQRTARPARIGVGSVSIAGVAVNRVWPEHRIDDQAVVTGGRRRSTRRSSPHPDVRRSRSGVGDSAAHLAAP